MKQEGKRAIVIPLVVGMIPIAVEPSPVVVAVSVEHVWIAVGIGDMCARSSVPLPVEYSPG